MTQRAATVRCALYTRKSSDEGLDQAFNSLDAQREACEAYVASQKAEGWKALPVRYDDGGFSGGSMERPALRRLMADIEAGKVDIVVVYKIDRLTRSLADFARMVELFDRHQVSFVSVTQAFNTTSSMGRLTLNVLLSFAQFEREVTGERIRDKIAASKARGMWMGGAIPIGYDKAGDGSRTLVINEDEAGTVRQIYLRYLALGSVHELERELREQDLRTKETVQASGKVRGGVFFSRGNLFHLLRNRIYLGEIVHRGQSHPGLHPAIIEPELFDQVQEQLAARARRGQAGAKLASHALVGRIFDADDNPMSPTFSYSRQKRLYRYYVSAPLQQGTRRAKDDRAPRRISASVIEDHLRMRMAALFPKGSSKSGDALAGILRVGIQIDRISVTIAGPVPSAVSARLAPDESLAADEHDNDRFHLTLPFHFSTRKGRTEVFKGDRNGPRPDPVLIRALRKAHAMVTRDASGMPVVDSVPATPRQQRLIRLAFLAPDIQRDILAGNQPPHMTISDLIDTRMPILWSEQREFIRRIAALA